MPKYIWRPNVAPTMPRNFVPPIPRPLPPGIRFTKLDVVHMQNSWGSNAPSYVDPPAGRPHRHFKQELDEAPSGEIQPVIANCTSAEEGNEDQSGDPNANPEALEQAEINPQPALSRKDRRKQKRQEKRKTEQGRVEQKKRRDLQRYKKNMFKLHAMN